MKVRKFLIGGSNQRALKRHRAEISMVFTHILTENSEIIATPDQERSAAVSREVKTIPCGAVSPNGNHPPEDPCSKWRCSRNCRGNNYLLNVQVKLVREWPQIRKRPCGCCTGAEIRKRTEQTEFLADVAAYLIRFPNDLLQIRHRPRRETHIRRVRRSYSGRSFTARAQRRYQTVENDRTVSPSTSAIATVWF